MPDLFEEDNRRENALFVDRMFAGDVPALDIDRAFQAVLVRAALARSSGRNGAIGLALAAAIAFAVLLTPLGSYATQFLTIFEPKSFVPLGITAQDSEQLRLMPHLSDFGRIRATRPATRVVRSAAEAASIAGFWPRALAYSPPSRQPKINRLVLLPSTDAFTFSAARAQAYENRFHRHLPPMPAGLDGTTIRATLGPGVMTTYGVARGSLNDRRRADMGEGALVFVQYKAPYVTSTGASIETLGEYLLSLPNVPAHIADQLRAIGDPSSTVPVPFEITQANAEQVDVDGTRGLAIGDQTGLGAGVLWQKNGIVYLVEGSMPQSEILKLANGLR